LLTRWSLSLATQLLIAISCEHIPTFRSANNYGRSRARREGGILVARHLKTAVDLFDFICRGKFQAAGSIGAVPRKMPVDPL